jgi:hypothetical protein
MDTHRCHAVSIFVGDARIWESNGVTGGCYGVHFDPFGIMRIFFGIPRPVGALIFLYAFSQGCRPGLMYAAPLGLGLCVVMRYLPGF